MVLSSIPSHASHSGKFVNITELITSSRKWGSWHGHHRVIVKMSVLKMKAQIRDQELQRV